MNEKIKIVNYHDANSYIKDSPYIRRGYLLNCNTIPKVLKSLFMIHNETVNIWSHLIASIIVIFLIIYTSISKNKVSSMVLKLLSKNSSFFFSNKSFTSINSKIFSRFLSLNCSK